jgi:antitoxin (DNA-binding transcriptional repressor) of toxin-antitoxin stability system
MDLPSGPLPPGSPQQVSKSRFKAQAQALELFRQVETSGEPLVVTDHGRPTLEVRPYRPARPDANPLEELRGSVLRFDDPFAPVGENDWEALA